MKGTIHCIHKLNNQWIFITHEKVGNVSIPKRYPFILESLDQSDGQEIIGEIINQSGIEFIKQKS